MIKNPARASRLAGSKTTGRSGRLLPNPAADYRLADGDELVVIAERRPTLA
jgi:hypothetical protein